MGKTNFTKVEEALAAGLTKMNLNNLGKLADVAKQFGDPELRPFAEQALEAADKTKLEKTTTLYHVLHGIKTIKDKKFYEDIGISRDDIAKILEKPNNITPEDYEKLLVIKAKILDRKKQLMEANPEKSDDQLVSKERKKHINKRFNVNEKWLPLK